MYAKAANLSFIFFLPAGMEIVGHISLSNRPFQIKCLIYLIES